jgi:hypothetical protein
MRYFAKVTLVLSFLLKAASWSAIELQKAKLFQSSRRWFTEALKGHPMEKVLLYICTYISALLPVKTASLVQK